MNKTFQPMKNITIRSIELVNFMCHGNLKVVFEKMITCIGGRNGTGKSAIMIALGVLFGQRTQALERGSSFSNLIKTGCNQATIKVVVNNYLKYKPERYGDSIVIEKRLREKGSKISIYNQHGKIFNIRKNELENIIDVYSLKFDNPLNFLTQEKSKKFLNISKPELLYEFYYQGTEFKNINEELETGFSILQEMREKIEDASTKQSEIESKLQIQKGNLKFLEFNAEAALERLKNEEAWRVISDKRSRVQELTDNISAGDKQIFDFQEERRKLLELQNSGMDEESTKAIQDRITELTIQCRGVDNEYQEFLNERSSCTVELEKIRKKSKIELIKSELNGAENRLNSVHNRIHDLEKQKDEAYEAAQNEHAENEEKQSKSYALKKQIDYLKKNAHDSNIQADLANFKRIRDELERHCFKDSVIGPVSDYVRLREQKWFKPISIILKKSLTNYIVFNNEDKVKLFNIFKKLGINYSITQMSSKEIYSNLQTNKNYKTLIDVLEIREKLILNQLVTLNSIEQIILIENREDAHSIIRSLPKNVDCAYTPTGDRIKMVNGSLSDFRSKDDGSYWFEDKTSKISKYETELSRLEISDNQKRRYNQIINQIGNTKSEIDGLEKKCRDLKLELETLQNLKENDTEGLEKRLLILDRSISSLYNRKRNLENEIYKIEEEKKAIVEKNVAKKNEYFQRKEKSQSRMNKIDCDVMIIENVKASKIQEKRLLRDQIDEEIKVLGSEPGTPRNCEDIAKEKKFIIEFKRQAKHMDSKEIIEQSIAKLEDESCFINSIRERFEKSIQETMSACNKRIQKRDEIKERSTKESIELFKEYTMKSGYVGEMSIDHENKRLDMRMKVHNAITSGSKSTLSGGERSFAGVCFLLSMWRCFKCPVKVLDEFDVFMDSLNRKMAIRSLFDFFKENDIQVLLITPLDIADLVDPDCDIKVLKKLTE